MLFLASSAKAVDTTVSPLNTASVLSFKHISECAGITELNHDSCLVQNVYELLSPINHDSIHGPPPSRKLEFLRRQAEADSLTSPIQLIQQLTSIVDSSEQGIASVKEIAAISDWLDLDKDGDISLEEIQQVETMFAELAPFLNSENSEIEISEIISNLDTNKDGVISEEDVEAVIALIQNSGLVSAPIEIINQFSSILDSNEDGTVSSEEIVGATAFFDLDNDGNITIDELQQAETLVMDFLPFMLPENATALVDDVITGLDLNQDGVVSETDVEQAKQIISYFYTDVYDEIAPLMLQLDVIKNSEIMYLLDLNGDGEVDEEELEAVKNQYLELLMLQIQSAQIAGYGLEDLQNLNLETLSDMLSQVKENATTALESSLEDFYFKLTYFGKQSEAFSFLDLNSNGVIEPKEITMIEEILLGLYENGIYPGVMPMIEETIYNLDVELAYTMLMSDEDVPESMKESTTEMLDINKDGTVDSDDLLKVSEMLLSLAPKVVNMSANTMKDITETGIDKCVPPLLLGDDITALVDFAKEKCQEVTLVEYNQVVSSVKKLLDASECWVTLCGENTKKEIYSEWMEECASISLPWPLPSTEIIMDSPEDYEQDVTLGCMLDYVMSSSHGPENFGLASPISDDPYEQCYPPGHDDMLNSCVSKIGPKALDVCKDFMPKPDSIEEDDDNYFSFSYDYDDVDPFSYDYNDHMSYEYTMDPVLSYDYNWNPVSDVVHIENLCSILIDLSTTEGKGCIKPMCEMDHMWNNHQMNAPAPSPTPDLGSDAPSITPDETPKSVEVKFKASMTFSNLRPEDIPTSGAELDKMVKVLASAITESLPAGSTAKILKIGGISVSGLSRRRRRMDASSGVDIEFEVTKTIACDGQDCDGALEESEAFYTSATTSLETAVQSGTFETSLKTLAAEEGVSVLENVEVDETSFLAAALEKTVVVDDVNTDDGNNIDDVEQDDADGNSGDGNENSSGNGIHISHLTLMVGTTLSVVFGFVYTA